MRSSILKSGAFDALAHRIHPFCIYMFVPFVGFLEVDSCEFFGIRPAFFSAVDNIHSIWPLALRNSSAAHRSMASYISASLPEQPEWQRGQRAAGVQATLPRGLQNGLVPPR